MRSIRNTLVPFLLFALALSGCQTTGLSKEQRDLLQQSGFYQTDDGWMLNMSAKLLFASDSDQLSPEVKARITNITRQLLKVGINRAHLEGHTDDKGPRSYNDELSTRRAQSVANAMAEAGMDSRHITVRGVGQSKPLYDNQTSKGRSENRRVVMIVDPSHY